ncbi:aldehyde dehydrogenase family protein [Leucobacter sp. W1038]|uniref:aldehyde dehydrogenase family protein n=1 Tax=Leucobacter sp. W1038 TaxID=3438281 RepID=UPI003D994CC6
MGVDRDEVDGVAAAAEARVEAWLAQLEQSGADLLEGVRRDPGGFAFTRGLLETIVGSADPFAAALGLREASRNLPPSLPARDRLAMRAGGIASLGLPWAVLPIARRWLRERVSPLVLAAKIPGDEGADLGADTADAPERRPEKKPEKRARKSDLGEAIASNREAGLTTVVALRGDDVLGPAGVETAIHRLKLLASLPEVTHLAIDPARVLAGGSDWSVDRDAQLAALALRPVLEAATAHDTTVSLTPTGYRGALLAPEILVRALTAAACDGLRAGVTLLAELPESRGIAERLIRFAHLRAKDGGAPLEVTVDIAGISGREQIASLGTGLAVPTLGGRVAQEAQWLRLMDLLLGASASGALRVVAASEDPHLLAAALELAERRGGAYTIELQLRAGTADGFARALSAAGHRVRVHLPFIPPKEFAGALGTLIALAAEAADTESTLARLAALVEGASDPVDPLEDGRDGVHPARARGLAALEAERESLRQALELASEPFPASQRTQRRDREWDPSERDSALFYRPPADTERFDTGGLTAAVLGLTRGSTGRIILEPAGPSLRLPVISESGFANEPDTDATRPENREWVRRLLAQARDERTAQLGDDTPYDAEVDPEAIIDHALAAGEAWRAQRPADRATRVRRLALGTVAARDRLVVALASESGAPAPVIDAEINGAVDAARYLGQLTAGLGAVRGAEFQPDPLALVVAEAGVPLDERAEALIAVLAAGSTVVCVAHPTVARSTAVLLEEWQAAGLPAGLVTLVTAGGERATRFAADTRVDRALVLGGRSTAEAFVRRRPDLRVSGRFRALGSSLIAPSTDPVAAVRAVVRSGFGAGHASPSLARALVLLGSAARSRRLRGQLEDAVRALRVGDTGRPGDQDPLIFDVGPLPEPVSEAGRRALTELQPGEEWLVEPEQLDDEGRLWQPGVRIGVRRDSSFWADAVGVPVIGVIAARTVDEAIALQGELGCGSVAALHAGEESEIVPWLERVRAATLVVGRATTGGRIERLPGGGLGHSGMGAQPLAGGPNRLVTLGSWRLREGTPSATLHLRGLDPEVQILIETAQSALDYESFDHVRRAALSDALAWRTTLGRLHDPIGLGVERNLLRHWPVSTHVRLAEGGELGDLIRVLVSAFTVGAPVSVSTGAVPPAGISEFLARQGITVSLERDEAWLERIAVAGPAGHAGGAGGAGVVLDDGSPALRVRLIGGDRTRAAEWMGGLARVTLWADHVTMAGPVELLAFLREQAVSVAAHRHGLASPVAGLDEWIEEVNARVR